MNLSLREQLLAAGLGTKKQAKEAERQRRRDKKNEAARRPEQEQRLAAERAAKAARDRELNRKRQEAVERKQHWALVKQLIEEHRLLNPQSHEHFNFIERG